MLAPSEVFVLVGILFLAGSCEMDVNDRLRREHADLVVQVRETSESVKSLEVRTKKVELACDQMAQALGVTW